MMTKVIVTGASGHIGYHVADMLLNKFYEVHCLIRRENINTLKLQRKGAVMHHCDLSNPDTYKDILEDADCLFHLAAENTTSRAEAQKIIDNTAGISLNVLNTCVEKKVRVIVYTSSVVVLGRSVDKKKLITEDDRTVFMESPYVEGKTKAEKFIEDLIHHTKADIRRLYPSWVIGPEDPKLTPPHKIITNYVAKGQLFYFSGGISLASVTSVAAGHVAAYEKGNPQGTYILGGDNITFKEFYDLLSTFTRHSKPIVKIRKWMIVIGAVLTKPLFKMMGMEPMLEPDYARSVFGNFSWYDSTKAIRELDYKIIPARQLLSDAVDEARAKLAATADLGFQRVENTATDEHDDCLLITGVPGWLGNRMVDIIINGDKYGEFQSKRKVRLLVQPQYAALLHLPEQFEIIYGDLNDKKALREALEGVKTVFHLAGAIYPKRIKTLYTVNTEGTKNLIDLCIEKGIRRIIYMSTDSVVGKGMKKKRVFDESTVAKPYKHYGKSKYLAERYLLDKTAEGLVDGTSLRGFWFFGPFAPQRQLTFINMFNWPRQIVFGTGKNYRSISHIDNIVQAFFKAEKNVRTYGKCYWICGNESQLSVDEIYETIALKLGKPYQPLHIPVFFCRLFGLADSVLGLFGYLHPSIHAAGKFYFDIAGKVDAAKRDFNYEPKVTFEDAADELRRMM